MHAMIVLMSSIFDCGEYTAVLLEELDGQCGRHAESDKVRPNPEAMDPRNRSSNPNSGSCTPLKNMRSLVAFDLPQAPSESLCLNDVAFMNI